MNYTTITINDQKVGLKFGMASFRYLSDKFVDGISFHNGELTEIGIAHLIYSGYYNNCLVKNELPKYTFEQIVDLVELKMRDPLFIEEMNIVSKVWSENEFVQQATNNTEETKKKKSRGKK